MQQQCPLVSIILPVHNGEPWIDLCLQSLLEQTYCGNMELCIFDDACTDESMKKIEMYKPHLTKRKVKVIINADNELPNRLPRGCGYAKNRAVQSSSGQYLCFLDADDVMSAERVDVQLQKAMALPKNTLIGCQVIREPPGSTLRYTRWINELTPPQLYTQIYTSHGPTIVMPTWFCHRSVFDSVGGFHEGGKGIPEDYIFFLKFLKLSGRLCRINRPLLTYRHHPDSTTFSVGENTIWNIRRKEVEELVLSKWPSFTIWNAGKQGRKFYRDISEKNRKNVLAFCDVDEKKIRKGVYTYELSTDKVKTQVPIVHFRDASKPFVICVKLDLTGGMFEKNLNSLNLEEGVDYVHFS